MLQVHRRRRGPRRHCRASRTRTTKTASSTTGPGWRLACVRCQCRCSAGFAGNWWSRGAGGSHHPASRRGGQWVRGTAIPSIVAVGVRVDDA
jgi:hypothetical protein